MNCKYCGSVYIYELYISKEAEKLYGDRHFTTTEFIVFGCSDCGKITFSKRIN